MASTHVLLGELEEKRQSQIDAIEQYLLAIELEPSLTEIRFRVGRLLYEVGRYPEASAQLEVVVNSNPANAVARELLGDTFREQGKFEQSLRQYRRVLAQGNVREALLMKTLQIRERVLGREHPDTIRSMGNLGEVYTWQGRHVDAEPLLVETLEINRACTWQRAP